MGIFLIVNTVKYAHACKNSFQYNHPKLGLQQYFEKNKKCSQGITCKQQLSYQM